MVSDLPGRRPAATGTALLTPQAVAQDPRTPGGAAGFQKGTPRLQEAREAQNRERQSGSLIRMEHDATLSPARPQRSPRPQKGAGLERSLMPVTRGDSASPASLHWVGIGSAQKHSRDAAS